MPWLPHIQKSIKAVWKPSSYLHSCIYMKICTYESSSWVTQGKSYDICNTSGFWTDALAMPREHGAHPTPTTFANKTASWLQRHRHVAKHSQSTKLFQNNCTVLVKGQHLMAEKTAFGHTASSPNLTQLIFVQHLLPQGMLKLSPSLLLTQFSHHLQWLASTRYFLKDQTSRYLRVARQGMLKRAQQRQRLGSETRGAPAPGPGEGSHPTELEAAREARCLWLFWTLQSDSLPMLSMLLKNSVRRVIYNSLHQQLLPLTHCTL